MLCAMKKTLLLLFTSLIPGLVLAQSEQSRENEFFEILITSGLREQKLSDQPLSVSVQTEQTINNRGSDHFEQLLPSIPNALFSGETSRPRYIQLRGIGERSEYTGAPNASVGMLIDDIDFSGIGMIGSLLDVKQVEVLRGPQGTRYGANALAGLINITSNDPTDNPEANFEISAGEDDLHEFKAITSGPLSQQNRLNYRLAVSKRQQDGFRDNLFLGRDDTNGIDETYLRTKLHWASDSGTQAKFTYLYADLDNGYDAFTLDNSFNTLSDEPGEDDQTTHAAAFKLEHAFDYFDLISTTSYANTESLYSYDEDWVFSGFWDINTFGYDYKAFFENHKERDTYSQEFRFVSNPGSRMFNNTTDWVAGVYALKLDESNETEETFSGFLASDYEAVNAAVFAQLDTRFTPKLTLTSGLRVENRDADYSDSNNQEFSPSDTMIGGQLALSYQLNELNNVYASVSRGYKAGGFNPVVDANFPAQRRSFDPEFLTNYELGWHYENAATGLSSNLSVFYMQRDDLQVDGSEQLDSGAFIFFIENIDSGSNYGLEWDVNWRFDPSWQLNASLGLLDSEFKNYSYRPRFQEPINLSGRGQAHAPNYQFHFGLQYHSPTGFFARAEFNAVDEFFFSNSHNQKSDPYQVVNARIGYEKKNWSVYLWGNNIFDEEYATRGFFFANDPNFEDVQRYVRLADRRQLGVTLRYEF